jgi:uncharacterized protein YkwD
MFNKKLMLSVAVLGMVASSFTTTVSAEKTLYLPGQNPDSTSQTASTNTFNAPSYENGVRVMSFGGFKAVSSSSSSASNFQNLSFSSTSSSSNNGVREITFGNRQSTATSSSANTTNSGIQFGNAYTGGFESKSSSSYSSSSTGIRTIGFGNNQTTSNASFVNSNNSATTPTQSGNPYSTNECSSSYANEMLNSINKFRSENGVGSLTLASELNNVACAHSKWQDSTKTLDHNGYQGSKFYERCQRAGTSCDGENIYYNTQPTVSAAMEWFKNSPSHRANMLYPEFRSAGFSLYNIYTTQLFRR